MKYEIKQVDEPDVKSQLTFNILTSLPVWFGIPESIKGYHLILMLAAMSLVAV